MPLSKARKCKDFFLGFVLGTLVLSPFVYSGEPQHCQGDSVDKTFLEFTDKDGEPYGGPK